MNDSFGVLILAGGSSKRMSFPKAYLKYQDSTFLQNIAQTYYHSGIKKIALVINKHYSTGEWKCHFDKVKSYISIVENVDSTFGRFYSLKKGLENFKNIDYCFIHNIDNPYIDSAIITSMKANGNSHGYTTPLFNEKSGHPILISKTIINSIIERVEHEHDLRNILKNFPRKQIVVSKNQIHFNINTPEEYNAIL